MIWFVGKDLNLYRPLIHLLSNDKITTRQYFSLNDILSATDDKPEAIVIDIDGIEALSLEFCWIITHNMNARKANILIFSSNTDESIEISAFEAGAADFILKPFKKEAVLRRLQTRINKKSQKDVISYSLNGQTVLEINKEEFSVYFNGEQITLSRKEFELLHLLASNPGKVFTREELYKRLWTGVFNTSDRTIDVHILRLRKKIHEDLILTLKGVGYRFSLKN